MKKVKFKGAAALTLFAATLGAHGSTNYWDNNGATPGFGVAGGAWGADSNWSGDSSGTSEPIVTNTGADDNLYFGSATVGLQAGTITVVGDNQSFNSLTFGAASEALTLAGGALNLSAPMTRIAAYNPSNTIASALAGAGGLYKGEVLNYGEFLTTSYTILFENVVLADCTAVYGLMGGSSINHGIPVPVDAFHFVNNATNLTCQMQTLDGTNLKCVKIELTQVGADIHGRALYAGYAAGRKPGYDFDTSTYNAASVATRWNMSSYGIPQLSLAFDAINPTVLSATAVTLFPDATLARVRRVNGALSGSAVNGGTPLPGRVFYFENNGTTATYQLQVIDDGKTKCVKIELSQVGADIQARTLYAKYLSRSELGFDFDTLSGTYGYQTRNTSISYLRDDSVLTLTGANTYAGDTTIANGTVVLSNAGNLGAGSYSGAIKNYGKLHLANNARQVLRGTVSGSGLIEVGGAAPWDYAALIKYGFMPATSQLLFPGQNLADYQSAAGFLGGAAIRHGTPLPATAYYFQNNGVTATFQLQIEDPPYVKCVKVELTQVGADIYGRRVYHKYINGSGLPYPDFDTSGTATTVYEAHDTAVFKGTQPPASLLLSGTNSCSGGMVINCGIVVAQTSRFSISAPVTVNSGGELRLSVKSDTGLTWDNAGGVGDGRAILVNRGGKLTVTERFNAGCSRPITIDGGTLHSCSGSATRSDNYINNLTLKSGAQVTGNPLQAGHISDAKITVTGTNASTIASGLCLVDSNDTLRLDVWDVTGDSEVDLAITGAIVDYPNYEGLPTVKTGAGTVSFSAPNTNKGAYTISGGAIRLAGDNCLNANNKMILNGGRLEMGGVSNTAGTLELTKDSELMLGSGSIAFENSSTNIWSGALTLVGSLVEKSVRFGTDNSGLTAAQLSAIDYSGARSVRLDSSGYLTAKPSGSTFMLR
ncbi:MAG: autotransporter-associated beta strand repeat-containing protein [Kiritimatiellae bacterium]|nr:autotransporter-associated beta strand repeat-containing protein [Kiritimatiellia bacterium]